MPRDLLKGALAVAAVEPLHRLRWKRAKRRWGTPRRKGARDPNLVQVRALPKQPGNEVVKLLESRDAFKGSGQWGKREHRLGNRQRQS
jgi:hypothetical protein